MAFSPDGKTLATGSGSKYSGFPEHRADPAEVILWDVSTGQELANLKGIELKVDFLGFFPDGKRLFAYDNRAVKVWELEKYTQVLAIKGYWNAVALAPTGKYIVCLGNEEVTLFDSKTGKQLLMIKGIRHAQNDPPHCIAIAPDGKSFAVGYDRGAVKIWNVPEKP